MDITGIDQRNSVFLSPAPNDRALYGRQILGFTPFLRLVWQKGKSVFDLLFRCPASRTMLTLTDCFRLDAVQAIVIQYMHKDHKGDEYGYHDCKNYHLFSIQSITPFQSYHRDFSLSYYPHTH